MALPQLTDDQIRDMSREEKDQWWLKNVFRGDMPQLTLRSAVTGFLLGGVLSATNLYVGAKTGWTLGVGVTSVILSFVIFRAMARSGFVKDLTILENNAVQSIATAAGYMTGPLISALMAYMFIENRAMPWFQIMVWNILASVLGVLVAFPMKRRFINDEQQPFPEGRAAGVVMDSLYPSAPRGGTDYMVNNLPVDRGDGAGDDEGARAGVFKAKALAAAAAIGAIVQMLLTVGWMSLLQIKLLGTSKSQETIWHLTERLDKWYYDYAAKAQAWVPRVQGVTVEQLGVTVGIELAMFGAGGLMGLRLTNSLMIGMALNYLLIAPLMIANGEILPKNFAAIVQPDGTFDLSKAVFGQRHIMNSWSLWWGVSMMVTASLAGLLAKPKVIVSAFTGLFRRGVSQGDCLRHIEFPLWITLVGVPIMVAITVLMNWLWFGVNPWLGLLSIPLIVLLTLIAANATALTSITPTGALSKITQFTFGAANPAHAGTNLITAGMTTEVASNASNLLMDIKPGYMLGAKPRQQAWGHVIGIFAGAIASTPLFFVLFLSDWTPETGQTLREAATQKYDMIGAVQWAAIAEVIRGMGSSSGETIQVVDGIRKYWGVLPVSAAIAMGFGALAAIVIEVLKVVTRGKFPLSAVGIGLGVVLGPESTIMMWIGALVFSFLEALNRSRIGSFGHRLWVDGREAVCAGVIAGWALFGVGDGVILAFVEVPKTEAQVAQMEKQAIEDAQAAETAVIGQPAPVSAPTPAPATPKAP
jgi:uncharacterized oligopeptide transporter (OPT) family protein